MQRDPAVELSIKGVLTYKEIQAKGSTAQHADISAHASSIRAANEQVQNDLKQSRQTSSPRAAELDKIAREGCKTAKKLEEMLKQINPVPAQGVRRYAQIAKATAKTVWQSREIKELEEKLERQDRTLNSGILKEL